MQNALLQNLNQEQLAAVTLPSQSALILAGAGSGKTRVLTTRIAWLIQTGQISPSGVLAVTFTNKASKEMLMRLSAMLPISTRGMWVGTFHGLCHRFLRTHYQYAGLSQTFQVIDSSDQLSFIKRLLKSNNIDDEKYPPRNVQYFINSAKEQGLRSNKVEAYDAYERKLLELYSLYEAQCQREGVVDFAELLLRTYEVLLHNQPLRQHYQARFKHILVDEFQDTNDLQYQWIKLIAGQESSVFAVGDDDQSIYAFRGANVGNMSAFEHDFSVQNVIKLEQNYRSYGHILDAANGLIAHNQNRLGKNLRTDAGLGEPVRVQELTSDIEEAHWIVEQIKELIRLGYAYNEVAILYRSNAQSRVIEHSLFSHGLPYRVYGGLRFFERMEVKHVIAYLQLMDNLYNDSAFLRVVNFPTRGIGARSIEQLQDVAKTHNLSLYEAVPMVEGKAGSLLNQFVQLIKNMCAQAQSLPLPEVVQLVLEKTGLLAHYQTEKEGTDRVENLEQVVSAAALFVMEEGFVENAPAFTAPLVEERTDAILDADAILSMVMSPLSAFLTHASLEAGEGQAQAGQEALQLMTVHAAKGLEFDAVFITGLEEGLFPHENSSQEEAGLEEERRLMYVAITRARKRLYLSFAQTRMLHGQTRYNLKSRFLDELPEDALKWLSPQVKVRAAWAGSKSAWDDASFESHIANQKAQAIENKKLDWHIGESVVHAKFGEGVIIHIEGGAGNARAQINFGRQVGIKLLDLSIAKLDKISA
jgi:DNA helicase-2/ATP-dependent DNA helicase PcrA